MPFVKESFTVPEKMPAFLFVMRTFQFTQGEAQRLLAKGRLLVNSQSIYNNGESIEGEIEVVYFKPSPTGKKALFHTRDFMIFEKESGTLVHPNTMATPYSMLDEIRAIAGDKANAVHRIDMETSGLLLASKHKDAERFLKGSFERKSIKKSYRAWVDGEVKNAFSVTEPIRINNDYSQTKHKVFISSDGKASHTDFEPITFDPELNATLLACYPHTGRTHQIRVHLFHVKHPILGDPIYGTTFASANAYLEDLLTPEERVIATGAERLMLHAQTLEFTYDSLFYIESKMDFFQQKILIGSRAERVFNC